jgi:hypothetical protein
MGKYPVNYGQLKLFPLLGFEYEAAISGKLKRNGESDYVFDDLKTNFCPYRL